MAKGSSVGSIFSYQRVSPVAAAVTASCGNIRIYPVNIIRHTNINFFFILKYMKNRRYYDEQISRNKEHEFRIPEGV